MQKYLMSGLKIEKVISYDDKSITFRNRNVELNPDKLKFIHFPTIMYCNIGLSFSLNFSAARLFLLRLTKLLVLK
jgi:hypothetical protein